MSVRSSLLCASLLFAATLVSASLLLAADVPANDSYRLIPPSARKPAPDFTLTDLSGRALTLAQHRGKVVLLDFWAVDCGGCKIEIPWYVDFDRQYRAQGLALIGLDMYGEAPAKIRTFMAQSKMDYSVAVGTDAIGSRYHLTDMPLTLLIDRRGKVAFSHAGIVDRAQFEHDIRELLAEK